MQNSGRSAWFLVILSLWLTLGGQSSALDRVGEAALFVASPSGRDWGIEGRCLWRTDGTEGGTRLLPGCSVPSGDISTIGGIGVYHSFGPGNQTRLWVTDGTAEGTRILHTFQGPDQPGPLVPVRRAAGPLWIFAASDSAHGREPWITDGTSQGTRLLADLTRGPEGSHPEELVAVGDGDQEVVFWTRRYDKPEVPTRVWRSDLSEEGTHRIRSFLANSELGYRLGPGFAVGDQVLAWRSPSPSRCPDDCFARLWSFGPAGTPSRVLAVDLAVSRGRPVIRLFQVVGDHAYFHRAPDGIVRTDGVEIEPVSRPEGKAPPFSLGGGRSLDDLDILSLRGEEGWELWAVSRQEPTATLLRDICPGTCDSFPRFSSAPDRAGNLVFEAYDRDTGQGLWVTDGTTPGTRRLPDYCPGRCDDEAQVLHHDPEGWLLLQEGRPERRLRWLDLESGRDVVLKDGLGSRVTFGDHPLAHLDDVTVLWLTEERYVNPWVTDGTPEGTRRLLNLHPEPGPDTEIPAVPMAVWARPRIEGATLGWYRGYDGGLTDSYRIEARTPETDGWVVLAEKPAGIAVSYYEYLTELIADRPLSLRIRAVNAAGVSAPSREVSVRPYPQRSWPYSCDPATELCLDGGRYGVKIDYRDHHSDPATHGKATPLPLGEGHRSGNFSFFAPDNVDLVVKALDGSLVNGHTWLFHGALTDLEYWLTVTDYVAGQHRTVRRPPGDLCGGADTRALVGDQGPGATYAILARQPARQAILGTPREVRPSTGASTTCVADGETLCLLDGRYAVSVAWHGPDGEISGIGGALPIADRSGSFWFFRPDNVELVVKVLDGTPVNGKVWVFYGGLTDLGYTLSVTDTLSGASRSYVNEPGNICGGADTAAF